MRPGPGQSPPFVASQSVARQRGAMLLVAAWCVGPASCLSQICFSSFGADEEEEELEEKERVQGQEQWW